MVTAPNDYQWIKVDYPKTSNNPEFERYACNGNDWQRYNIYLQYEDQRQWNLNAHEQFETVLSDAQKQAEQKINNSLYWLMNGDQSRPYGEVVSLSIYKSRFNSGWLTDRAIKISYEKISRAILSKMQLHCFTLGVLPLLAFFKWKPPEQPKNNLF